MDNVETPGLESKLATYCHERQEIVAAYLFGSQAKGTATSTSDVDVALLLADNFDLHENYAYRLEQITALELCLHKPVDVVILNQASLVLRNQVLKYGHRVYEADHRARVNFEVQSRQMYHDFLPTLQYLRSTLRQQIQEENLAYRYRGYRNPLDDARRTLERLESTPDDAV